MKRPLAAAVLAATIGLAAAAAGTKPIVPPGMLVASDAQGRIAVVDRSGHVLRRIRVSVPCCQSIALAPDRRHAFASAYSEKTHLYSVYDVDLASGRAHRLGYGGSVALSPDGRRLAYFSVSYDGDILHRTGIAVRDVDTGAKRVIPFSRRTSWSTPPDVQINWAPDNRRVAVAVGASDGGVRIVDVDTATDVESQPPLAASYKAPAFLDDGTLLTLTNCCIGTRQRMETVDLQTGARSVFAVLPEPPEALRRIAPGTFVATTPDGFLLRFSKGRVRRLGTGKFFSVSG
jgi:dipeptidyl aminopeptidase/acylaminoacyl peptidase